LGCNDLVNVKFEYLLFFRKSSDWCYQETKRWCISKLDWTPELKMSYSWTVLYPDTNAMYC